MLRSWSLTATEQLEEATTRMTDSTGTSTLVEFSNQLANAVEQAARSVVAVHARPRIASSGVHWRDGLILTTDATVRRDEGITVTLPDGRNVNATVQGRDAFGNPCYEREKKGFTPNRAAEYIDSRSQQKVTTKFRDGNNSS